MRAWMTRHCHSIMALLLLLLARARAEDETALKERLIADYGPRSTRPAVAATEKRFADPNQCAVAGAPGGAAPPDLVQVQIYVDKYHTLDMASQSYGVGGYLRLLWNDKRLAYNSTADGGCVDEILFERREAMNFWKPVLYWEYAKVVKVPSEDKEDGYASMFAVYPNGNVFWSRQFDVTLHCAMYGENIKAANSEGGLATMPFDVQVCPFVLGPYAEDSSKVRVAWRDHPSGGLTNYAGVCLGEWTVLSVLEQSQVLQYAVGNYTYADARIRFSRNPEIWLWTYVVPAICMTLLQYIGFYIDPQATPARVSLGMITLLVVMTNFAALIRQLPAITAGLPWLGRLLLYSFCFNVLAMMEQVHMHSYMCTPTYAYALLHMHIVPMVEQVLVSFGTSISKWLAEEQRQLAAAVHWATVLNRLPYIYMHMHMNMYMHAASGSPEGRGSSRRRSTGRRCSSTTRTTSSSSMRTHMHVHAHVHMSTCPHTY